MGDKEKRSDERKKIQIVTYVKKKMPDGSLSIMQFVSKDVSRGGVFIATEDLSLFDLGEEQEILVDDLDERLYEGKARIVRSARVFTENGEMIESGFGLMFLNPDKAFIDMLARKLEAGK